MKKFTKVISVILIISAMLMATLMPAFAAFPDDAEAYIWTTKEQQSDPDIYKITVHLEANYPVAVGDLRVYWPTAEWKLIRNTGVKNTTASTRNAINYLGAFLDDNEYDETDYEEGYVMGPASSDLNVIVNVAAKYFNDAVPQSTYSAIQLAWITGNENHYYYDSSRWGNEVYEFYVQNVGGDPAAQIANVDVREEAPLADAACWSSTDKSNTAAAVEVYQGGGNTVNFAATYFHAPETDSSIINPYKDQIRFKGQGNGAYEKSFDVRVLAQITEDDLVETFGDTATNVGPSDVIAEAGFIFERLSQGADGTLTLEAAKEYLEGSGSLGGTWKEVKVNTISTAFKSAAVPADYVISCLITDIADGDKTDGVKAVGYVKGVDGTVYCYPAVYELNFETLYNTHFSTAFPG